jgi:hypothetical protein
MGVLVGRSVLLRVCEILKRRKSFGSLQKKKQRGEVSAGELRFDEAQLQKETERTAMGVGF